MQNAETQTAISDPDRSVPTVELRMQCLVLAASRGDVQSNSVTEVANKYFEWVTNVNQVEYGAAE
jgi:hypothetical protein